MELIGRWYSAIYKWVNPAYYAIMTTRLTIDGAGRVVIPKPLRDELDLAPGDTLELETAGESITLRPTRGATPLTKEKGVWVFRTGRPLSLSIADDLLKRIRTERDQHNLTSTD
ncbi:MAG: AbrB/MazE/SpoVT family DNA-binding domain-containing protein [Limisphaerales bacterium]